MDRRSAAICVDPDAAALKSFAVVKLQSYLTKLFDVRPPITNVSTEKADAGFIVELRIADFLINFDLLAALAYCANSASRRIVATPSQGE